MACAQRDCECFDTTAGPPAPLFNFGPFPSDAPPLPPCKQCCASTSFTLRTQCGEACAAACDGAAVMNATPYQILSAPGWYVLQRVLSPDPRVVVIVAQTLPNRATSVLELTPEAPYALTYVDMVQNYAVFVYVGLVPAPVGTPFPTTCCTRSANLSVSGGAAGCPALVYAPGAVCPGDDIRCACVAQGAVLLTGATPTQLLFTIMEPILVPDGQAAVLHVTRRPCASITPNSAGDDLTLTFNASFPGLTYLLLTYVGGTTVVVTAIVNMQTSEVLDVPPPVLRMRGGAASWPGQAPWCVTTLYCVQRPPLPFATPPPFVRFISQVVADEPGCRACGDVDARTLTRDVSRQQQPTLVLPSGCSSYGLQPVVISVDGTQDLQGLLTSFAVYSCGPELLAMPPVEFVPGPGPLALCVQANAPQASTRPAKLMAMSSDVLHVLLPQGAVAGDVVGVMLSATAVVVGADNVVQLRCGVTVPSAAIVVVTRSSGLVRTYSAVTNAEIAPGAWVAVVGAAAAWIWWRPDRALFVWVTNLATPLEYTFTSVVCGATALFGAVPTYLRPSALLLPDAAAPSNNATSPAASWWCKPATGDLATVLNASGAVTTRAFTLGTYLNAAAAAAYVVCCAGAYADAAADTLTVLVIALQALPAGTQLHVTLAALAANHTTLVAAAGACALDIQLDVVALGGVAAGTTLALRCSAGSDVVTLYSSTPALAWAPNTDATASLGSVCPTVAAIAANLSFVVHDGAGTIYAQTVLSAPWRATGVPVATCGVGTLDLASYDARIGAAALQAPDELLNTATGACAAGVIRAAAIADVAQTLVSTPALWAASAAGLPSGLPLPAPFVQQVVLPGDIVIVGMQRQSAAVFRIATATTRALRAGSRVRVSTAPWFDVAAGAFNAPWAEFTLNADVPAGTSAQLVLQLGPGSVASSTYGSFATLTDASAAPTGFVDPYVDESVGGGVVTLFDVDPATLTARGIASVSVRDAYTLATLPAGLGIYPAGASGNPVASAATTAMQRTALAEYRGVAANGGAWITFVLSEPPHENTYVVVDWGAVSTFVYNAACIVLLPDTTTAQQFRDAVITFLGT